jgi:hypothetical protein
MIGRARNGDDGECDLWAISRATWQNEPLPMVLGEPKAFINRLA